MERGYGRSTSFSGRDLSTTADGHEVRFIEIVVKDISLKLPAIDAEENLVGMRIRINGMVTSLNAFPDEFCMVGIWGMGGGGKTTLARAIFDQISFQFECISYVANVREVSKPNFSDLKKLQQQVLRDVLNDQGIIINNVFDGKNMMKKKMPGRKVLIVLDDVDHIDQLKALAGERNWFKPGSIIIITTRDKQVLIAHKVNFIHDVNLLTDEEAICLLSRCAFGLENPIPGYQELARKVVSYAAGLPLTITILGSSLCDENEDVWIDTLKELEKIPLDGTLQKLELSYMALDTNSKEIFLDVACILKGWRKVKAIRVLESHGFHAIRGLSIMEKRSLLTISRHGFLHMHGHIEEMGRYIVRRLKLNDPGRHTRMWIQEEIKDTLVNELGTEETTCLKVIRSEIRAGTLMKGLGKMDKLRVLLMGNFANTSDRELGEDSLYLPNSLQYLDWNDYPFCFLPKTFQAGHLVGLYMRLSKMEQLWKEGEKKVLHKLRFLHLSTSKLRSFDLGLAPNLEVLDLEYCYDLVELHISVGCPKLKSLNLNCSKLSTFDLRSVPNIETLKLSRCGFEELDIPCECPQLKSMYLSGPKLRFINLGLTSNIKTLNLEDCDRLEELDMPRECPQLKSLKLSCPRLRSFNPRPTSNIETSKLVEFDYLGGVDMFLKCPQLESFDLTISMLETLDLRPTPNLETLKLQGGYNLVEHHMHDECCKLKTLNLGCPHLRTFDIGLTLNLEALTLNYGHDDLVEFLLSIGCPRLKYLKLIYSELRTIELTHNLKKLILEDCDLVELYIPDGDVKLEYLGIIRCSELKTLDLGRTPNLESLRLVSSSLVEVHAPVGGLKKLNNLKAKGFLRFTRLNIVDIDGLLPALDLIAESVDICPLHPDNNFPKFQFKCAYKEDLPSSIGNIEKLISEGFSCACTGLQSFFGSICGLQHLTKLTLEGSIPEAPKDLDQLQCLEKLTLNSTKIKHLPDSICLLKHLKSLKLYECELLEKLPEDVGRLECLETLTIEGSIVLRDIPNSICRMKSLKYFGLHCCNTLNELPEELGRLECL